MTTRSLPSGPPWFRRIAWLLDYPLSGSIAGLIVVLAWLFSNGWVVAAAAGAKGSPTTLLVLVAIALTVVVTLFFTLRFLRWPLVYLAAKSLVADLLRTSDLTHETVLIGGSSGGGIAVGMVGKAMQELTGRAPRVVVIDQDYVNGTFEPLTGRLIQLQAEFLAEQPVLYVTSYVGTGRSRHAMLQALQIEGCKTLAFVVDESARDEVEYYLATGKRRIIPWPR